MKETLLKFGIRRAELRLKIPIASGVLKILREIKQNRQLYLVGGAIRDLLLGIKPFDYDFVIEGSGIGFAKEFSRKTRRKLVLLSEEDDEARVVYRKNLFLDFSGLKGRTLIDDLSQRDFTINALVIQIDPNSKGQLADKPKIIDYFHGLNHLKKRLIVPVSDDSFNLDPLRILRAFRFASELRFRIDGKVIDLGRNLNLTKVAPERIGAELIRIMKTEQSVRYYKILADLGLLSQIFPQAIPLFEDRELFLHSLKTYAKVEKILSTLNFFAQFKKEWDEYFSSADYRSFVLKLAALFHDIAKPYTRFQKEGEVHFYGHDGLGARIVEEIAKQNLRLPRKVSLSLKRLVNFHMRLHLLATAPTLTDRAIRRYFRDLGDEAFGLMLLTYADGYATAGKTHHLERTIARMVELKRAWNATKKVKPLITGYDLIDLGLKPGPIFKTILQEIEELQLDGKIKTKEEGIEYLKSVLAGLINT